MILAGYQGIGKSTASELSSNYIDLESSNFFVDGNRDENWYKVYANIAKHLSDQGYVVMTASHKIFRDYLKEQKIKFTTISPDVSLKDAWIEKLEKRFKETNKEKDYKALMNAKQMFEENVKDLQSEKNHYIIKDIDYSLVGIISELTYKQNTIDTDSYHLTLDDIYNTRVYIAGKMTGFSTEEIFKRFNRVEDILVNNNCGVMNPAIVWHLKDTSKFNPDEYLEICYSMLSACDVVIVLPDSQGSYGTNCEINYAKQEEKRIYVLDKSDNLHILYHD